MSVVKVKSHSRNGYKVSSYTRNTSSPGKTGDCSSRGIADKFREIQGKTLVKSEVSTGSKFIDKFVLPKIPHIGKYIKAYNISHDTMANAARIKATYDETCKKIK